MFIFGLQLFGISFNIGAEIFKLDKKYPAFNKKEIFAMFMENEWVSIGLSALILLFNLFIHAIIDVYFPGVREMKIDFAIFGMQILIPYIGISFIIAFTFGFGGQLLAYKYFGKLRDYISSKAD